jgi:hypothetical protein
MSQIILETERLHIRPFLLGDLPILDQTIGAGTKVNDEAAMPERHRSDIRLQI